jgi:hypothetical protein
VSSISLTAGSHCVDNGFRVFYLLTMPTATLIKRGGSSSSSSSLVVELVASSSSGGGGGRSHSQEVDNCNGKDASISVAISQSKQKICNSGGDEVSILRSKKKIQGSKETSVAKKSQPAVKAQIKTRKRKKCSHEGCTNIAVRGGVCITHGAKVEVKRCGHEGCDNKVVKGGVCVTHGAKRKRCSSEGCTNQFVKGGVCVTHGAKMKRCNFEGCTNGAKKGGVCVTHGAKRKRCSHEGCTNGSVKGGVCVTHGAMSKRCSVEGCAKRARGKIGVCQRHH